MWISYMNRINFINEYAISALFPNQGEILVYLKHILNTPNQEAWWILRACVRLNLLSEKDWIIFYTSISQVPWQKAGWALDNAIEKGWITQENFKHYIELILPIPYQKAGFALRCAFEKKWINLVDIFLITENTKSVEWQSLGWLWRHVIKTQKFSNSEKIIEVLSLLKDTPWQELWWFLDILGEYNLIDKQILWEFIEKIAHIPWQSATWSFRWLKKDISFLGATLMETPFQSYGWHMRRLMNNWDIWSDFFQIALSKIHNVPWQEPWWAIDLWYERWFIDSYFFRFYIKNKITLSSRCEEWVILHFFKNKIPYSELCFCLNSHTYDCYEQCIKYIHFISKWTLQEKEIVVLLDKFLKSNEYWAGILLTYCIDNWFIAKQYSYFFLKKHITFQWREWLILSMLSNSLLTINQVKKYENWKHPLILLWIIKLNWIQKWEFHSIYKDFVVSLPEDYILLDMLSQKWWITRSLYQPFFTFDDI